MIPKQRIPGYFAWLIPLILILVLMTGSVASAGPLAQSTGTSVFINELHYDNSGTDTGEAIEIAGPAGTDLSGWTIVLYNGNGGAVYGTTALSGVIPDQQAGFGTAFVTYPSNGIQNGSPDGIALVDAGSAVVQFLSYEGTFTAVGGPANGMTSTDIGVAEGSGTPVGDSLQLVGFGSVYEDFSWATGGPNTFGAVNTGQTFGLGPTPTPTPIGPTPTPTPTPPPAPFVPIFDIQFTTDPGGNSTYAGQTVRTQGVVTAFFGAGGERRFFIQDGSGPWSGLFLFEPSGFLNVGDEVEVTGMVQEFFGLTEIAFGTTTVLSIDNLLPAPEVLLSGDVPQEPWESVLVRVENATVTNPSLGFGEWEVDDGSGAARVDDLGSYSYVPTAGDLLAHVQGPLYYSFGNFKIEPRDDADISLLLTIPQIQGSGQFSPYQGAFVTTSGVVTLISGDGRDMWIQDPVGDGDPTTSDGIFVDDRNRLSPMPMVGDVISITAEVEELQFGNALPLTRLDSFSGFNATIQSSGNPLPAPVPLDDLPNEVIADGIAFWEPLEGMLVSVRNAPVVAATSRFGEFGMLTKDDAKPGSGFYPQTQQILLRDLGNENVDYNPEIILVDDASLMDAIEVIPGDRVRSLVGVVDYTFGAYKLQPASFDIKYHKLPMSPVSTRSGPNGNATITTYNIENLFDLIDNPAKDDGSSTPTATELEMQLTKLALSIEVELELPEIIVVQETENQEILQVLGDRVNAEAGTSYVATSFETSDGRGIEAGFLWDAKRVSLLNAFQLDDTIVPGVSAAFGPGSPSPGREPIVGVFDIRGYTVTIVGNHFKSKSGDDPLFGVNWPPIRITEVQRKAQAQVVRDYVNLLFSADPDALVMVAGDLNDFQFSEPGEGPDNPVAIVAGGPGEVPLTNLLDLEKAAETYTFVFNGNSQVLDHMLVSPALYDMVVGADILHFNASYPASADTDDTNTLRAADHDPLEGRFKFK